MIYVKVYNGEINGYADLHEGFDIFHVSQSPCLRANIADVN